MKNTITLVLFLFLSGIVHSQIILPEDGSCGKYFDYDDAGNRVQRYICNSVLPFHQSSEDESSLVSLMKAEMLEEAESIADMIVFPNPSTGKIDIKTIGISTSSDLFIYDELGRVVHQGKLGNGKMDLSSFQAGIYIIVVRSGTKVYTAKLVRSH